MVHVSDLRDLGSTGVAALSIGPMHEEMGVSGMLFRNYLYVLECVYSRSFCISPAAIHAEISEYPSYYKN